MTSAVLNSVDTAEFEDSNEVVVFGDHPEKDVQVKKLVVLAQVRSEKNSEYQQLKDSIRTSGLLNPIDIAYVNEAQLEEYIAFTNQLWGSDVKIEDFIIQRDEFGKYNLVVAGHTRTYVINELENEDELGRIYSIRTKVHDISDPEDIISLQLDENLHSKPVLERQAMAIVEAYEYGKLYGRWDSPESFARLKKGKFTKRQLKDAIGFATLPPEAREFVLSGLLTYTAAVQIGRSSGTILDDILVAFDPSGEVTITPEVEDDLMNAYRLEIDRLITHIQSTGINSSAAKKYIQGQTMLAEERIAKAKGLLDDDDTLFDYDMVSDESVRAQYLAQKKRELQVEHNRLAQHYNSGDTIMALHADLSGVATTEATRIIDNSNARMFRVVLSPLMQQAVPK
jgi:hypothetical protein